MEVLGRVNLYRNLINKDISQMFKDVILVNLKLLENVEELFMTDETGKTNLLQGRQEVITLIRRNTIGLKDLDISISDRRISALQKKINKQLELYEKKENTDKNARSLFNQLLNEIEFFNNANLEKDFLISKREKQESMTQVFLSHAHDDKAYAAALFYYFYDYGIYLYVGWMHNDEILDGIKLKRMLNNELTNSNQLLFLRTVNSELDISGKQYLKPSCSWELGNFYHGRNGDDKFLINLYSVDGYKNSQLHGLRLYTGVVNKRLEGKVIQYEEE